MLRGRAAARDAGHRSRAYRLKRKESGGEGIRRILTGRLDETLDLLGPRLGAGPAEAVHEARKDLKRARSVLRLLRGQLGAELYVAESQRLREAGRALSAARDAEVRVATLEGLRDHYRDELSLDATSAILIATLAAREAVAQLADPDSVRAAAAASIAGIELTRASAQSWPLDGDWNLIGAGLSRSYRRGRRALRATAAEPTGEAVHEWRKRVKDLWYQLRLLEGSWPAVLGKSADEAHELSDLLGDHHDLTVLGQGIDQAVPGLTAAERAELEAVIGRRQAELVEGALPLGRRLYAEKPGAFERRVSAYWRAWR